MGLCLTVAFRVQWSEGLATSPRLRPVRSTSFILGKLFVTVQKVKESEGTIQHTSHFHNFLHNKKVFPFSES